MNPKEEKIKEEKYIRFEIRFEDEYVDWKDITIIAMALEKVGFSFRFYEFGHFVCSMKLKKELSK